MYSWVECECGHRFFTQKEKPQCCKCKQRFDAYSHSSAWKSSEKTEAIQVLQNKIEIQSRIMENLLAVMETYQYKIDEIVKELRDSLK
jgi:tyrosyl-tRNA synthetase